MVRVVVLLVHDLRKAEVCDLDFAADIALSEQDVARLQVVMDHRWLDLVQVFQSRDDLHHDGPRLAFWDRLMLEKETSPHEY